MYIRTAKTAESAPAVDKQHCRPLLLLFVHSGRLKITLALGNERWPA
jgi:hypothetical protein